MWWVMPQTFDNANFQPFVFLVFELNSICVRKEISNDDARLKLAYVLHTWSARRVELEKNLLKNYAIESNESMNEWKWNECEKYVMMITSNLLSRRKIQNKMRKT